LEGKDIVTYATCWQNRWLKYGGNLAAPRDPSLFVGDRLLFRRIVGERLIGTLISEDFVTSQLLQIVKPFAANPTKALYLLGILNSGMMAFYFRLLRNSGGKTCVIPADCPWFPHERHGILPTNPRPELPMEGERSAT
jgi:hypothetical protein